MNHLKIAYCDWGVSPCQHRRFAHFTKLIHLQAELFDPKKTYDLVVVTQNSDLTYWSRYPRHKTKILFDFVDSYLSIESSDVKNKFRGLAKFLTGQHRFLECSYTESLKRMIERADGVICSTPEQKQMCLDLNSNIHDILDFNDEQVREIKTNYEIGQTVNFVWEGMGANAWVFQEIAPVLKQLHQKRPIALHLVTDISYSSHRGPLAYQSRVKPYLNRILGDVPVYLYEWNQAILSAVCTRCDIALLPMPERPAIYWAKPENRLLMLWRMGLPAVASANPAFSRCMKAAQSDMACQNLSDWKEKLEALVTDSLLREREAKLGQSYGHSQAHQTVLCQKWKNVLESVF